MLTTILVLASLGQCSGGSCALPQAGYSFAPQFSYVPAYQPAAVVAPPQLYRLADSDGQFFTHTDPAFLQRWIADRNMARETSRLAAPKAPPPATLCPCAAGECPCAAKPAKAASLPVTPIEPPVIVALGPPPPEPR